MLTSIFPLYHLISIRIPVLSLHRLVCVMIPILALHHLTSIVMPLQHLVAFCWPVLLVQFVWPICSRAVKEHSPIPTEVSDKTLIDSREMGSASAVALTFVFCSEMSVFLAVLYASPTEDTLINDGTEWSSQDSTLQVVLSLSELESQLLIILVQSRIQGPFPSLFLKFIFETRLTAVKST